MDSVVLAGLTVKQLLVYGGIGLGALVLLGVLSRAFRSSKPASTVHRMARCPHCSWSGQISRHNPRCPRCNRSIPLDGKGGGS